MMDPAKLCCSRRLYIVMDPVVALNTVATEGAIHKCHMDNR
jgi:hypothetical protein